MLQYKVVQEHSSHFQVGVVGDGAIRVVKRDKVGSYDQWPRDSPHCRVQQLFAGKPDASSSMGRSITEADETGCACGDKFSAVGWVCSDNV